MKALFTALKKRNRRSGDLNPEERLILLETPATRWVGIRVYVPFVDGILFDTGYATARKELLSGVQGRPIARIVLTHAHEDHAGNAACLHKLTNLPIEGSPHTLDVLKQPERHLGLRLYRKALWGGLDPLPASALKAIPPEFQGEQHTWIGMDTPGHCQGHMVYHCPELSMVVLGDLFVTVKSTMGRPSENAADWMESLRRVIALKPEHLFCYHKGLLSGTSGLLEAKLHWMEERAQDIRALHAKGHSADSIAHHLFKGKKAPVYARGEFSELECVRSFLKEPGEGYLEGWL